MYDIDVRIYEKDLSKVILTLTGEDVISYTIVDRLSDGGLPLGEACSKRFTLSFDASKCLSPDKLDGRQVRVRLFDDRVKGASRLDKSTWTDAGVWFIGDTNLTLGGTAAEISGSDAISVAFESGFKDAGYPKTLKALVDTLTGAALSSPCKGGFYNEALIIKSLPEWGDKITLRRALGMAAFAAGGFARMDYSGNTEIVPVSGGKNISLSAKDIISLKRTGGEKVSLKNILYRFDGDDFYTRFSKDDSLEPSATDTVKAEGNPLVTPSILKKMVSHIGEGSFDGGEITWTGGEPAQAGDVIIAQAGDESLRLFVTENRVTLDKGGLKTESACRLNTLGASGGALTAGRRVFNSDGSLSFEAIGEVKQKVLALSKAYVNSLTAGDIQTGGLLASFIEAVKLRALSVSADEVIADEITVALAEIINAAVRRLDAGTVKADELVTAIIDAFCVKAETLSASSLSSDRLASALARFGVITAGSAEFDRATVKHLISSALNLSYGAAGEVFIENLAADYASMVSASVGRLCVRASDGEYYELNVNADGQISAEKTSVSAIEAQEGTTNGGRTIIETEISASMLNASSVKAARALINKLDASRIDADTLTAGRAFIESLSARDITSNSYLKLALNDLSKRVEEAGETAENALNGVGETEAFNEGLKRWLTLDENGLRQGKSGSVFSTLTDEEGFHILRRGSVNPVGSFDKTGLTAQGLRLGKITAKPTSAGGWVWTREV